MSPTSTEQVQAVVRIANEYGVPLWTIGKGRNNTYGGARRYRLEPRGEGWEVDKSLFVSPFLPSEGRYVFRFPRLDERLDAQADFFAGGERLLHARVTGERRPLDDGALLRALVRYPLVTVQVIGLIHLHDILRAKIV